MDNVKSSLTLAPSIWHFIEFSLQILVNSSKNSIGITFFFVNKYVCGGNGKIKEKFILNYKKKREANVKSKIRR